MGIPSYYSYLIKNFKNIVQKKELFNEIIHNFYLDSNSIVYDIIHNKNVDKNNDVEIIKNVCLKIEEYILCIKASEKIYISFDGIAPVAKLKQQKERRYKSKLVQEIEQTNKSFDTAKITPGTKFMELLDRRVKEFFKNRETVYGVKEIIVSTGKDRGEGEHKIFDDIRKTKGKNHVIYGLDADLIIISLNNLEHTNNIFLFRETPEFIKSLNYALNPNKLYFMNMENLKSIIEKNMIYNKKTKNENVIKDYVFLMMLMGNDFMPHFPSLNIRTFGLQMMLDVYKVEINKRNLNLIGGDGKIIWKNVRELFKYFKENEDINIKKEYKIRQRISNSVKNKLKTREDRLVNIPVTNREKEEYIDPYSLYWENRYYETLHKMERNDENVHKICMNYLEGLVWNMEYYTNGCMNWFWYYKYSYPPLFCDLLKYTPLWDVDMVEYNNKNINDVEQLSYVLPLESCYLLPDNCKDLIVKYKSNNEILMDWSYCRYFWETHVDFVDENFIELRNILRNNAL